MVSSPLIRHIKAFDVFPKTKEEVSEKTMSGAIVSVGAILLMLLLFYNELSAYLSLELEHEVLVDASKNENITMNIDVTVHMNCDYVTADIFDITGESRLDISDFIKKERVSYAEILEVHRNPFLHHKAFGFKNVFKRAIGGGNLKKLDGEGTDSCRMHGSLEVRKVPGNFHFAAGRSLVQHGHHVHDLQGVQPEHLNFTHHFKTMSFGDYYPGVVNPLDFTEHRTDEPHTMWQYFVKVVPTTYINSKGEEIHTNQFSVTDFNRAISQGHNHGLPGVFIKYDISSTHIVIREVYKPFFHFLTQVCAILGGVFTVSGMLDSVVFHLLKKLSDAQPTK